MPLGQAFTKGTNYIISKTTVGYNDGVAMLGGQCGFVLPVLLNWSMGGSKMTNAN